MPRDRAGFGTLQGLQSWCPCAGSVREARPASTGVWGMLAHTNRVSFCAPNLKRTGVLADGTCAMADLSARRRGGTV